MKDYNSITNQHIKSQFVQREILMCMSSIMDACFTAGQDGAQDMPNYFSHLTTPNIHRVRPIPKPMPVYWVTLRQAYTYLSNYFICKPRYCPTIPSCPRYFFAEPTCLWMLVYIKHTIYISFWLSYSKHIVI